MAKAPSTSPTCFDEPLLTAAEAEQLLALPHNSLAMMRYQRKGPPYIKIGRRVRYRRRAVFDWLEEQETSPAEAVA